MEKWYLANGNSQLIIFSLLPAPFALSFSRILEKLGEEKKRELINFSLVDDFKIVNLDAFISPACIGLRAAPRQV